METSSTSIPPGAASVGMTNQQRQVAGAAVLLVCLLLGSGVIWWFFYGSTPKQTVVKVDPAEQSRGTLEHGGLRGVPQPRMITKTSDGWLVRGSAGQVKVTPNGADFQLTDFRYVGGMKLSEEQMTLLTSRWRILHDPAMAKAWGITAQQKQTLAKLKGGSGGLEPAPAQRLAVQQAFAAYQAADDGPPRSDAQKSVLDALDQMARENFAASHKALADRAEQIRNTLTAPQIKKILKR